MKSGEAGIYYPQNKEYVRTSEMVNIIADVYGKKIILTKLLNPFVIIASKTSGRISGLANKAFGNMVYDKTMSNCFDGKYQICDLKTSINHTEGN